MFSEKLQNVRIEMLKGGVNPRYVKRTIRELYDHYIDLKHNLVNEGIEEIDAELQAENKIGDLNKITKEIINKKELQSWISLHPKIVFLVTPVLLYPLALVACIFLLIGVTKLSGVSVSGFPTPFWFQTLSTSVVYLYNIMIPILMVFYFIFLIKDRIINKSIIYLSIALVALFGSILTMNIDFPKSSEELGTIQATLQFFGYVPFAGVFQLEMFITGVLHLAMTCVSAWIAWKWFAKNRDDVFIS